MQRVTEIEPGTQVGQYRIVRLLGDGGMGVVYEAEHEVLGRRAAIKFLREEWVNKTEVVTRFLQEAQAVNRIDHDGIINVYDYGDGSDGFVYFVMEFLEGETLLEFQAKNRPLSKETLIHLYSQIISALAAAHAAGIVHRDLKPANVFIIRREANPQFVKLLDFGVAKVTGEKARPGLTKAGSVLGTPEYMSPEQIAGKPTDARSDIYSLGVMLYEALVGRVPFNAEGFGALAAQVLRGELIPPSQLDADVDPVLESLAMKMLVRERDHRYQTIAEVQADFPEPEVVDEAPVERPRPAKLTPAPVPASTAKPPSRLPLLVVALSAALAVIAVIVVVVVRGGSENEAGAEKPVATVDAAVESSIASEWKRGEFSRSAEMASGELERLLGSSDAAAGRAARAAVLRAATAPIAPLLYAELEATPQRRAAAARALTELELPEAAPKLRAALEASGGPLRIEIAAHLLDLGDRDAIPILEKAITEKGRSQLVAAAALSRAGVTEATKPILAETFNGTPAGRPKWLRAATELVRLGDAKAKRALTEELVNPNAARSVGAAVALATQGDKKAQAFLERLAGGKDGARAAVAIARQGNEAALGFVPTGLASDNAVDRAAAAAVAAHLLAEKHGEAIAEQATNDTDIAAKAAALAAVIAIAERRSK